MSLVFVSVMWLKWMSHVPHRHILAWPLTSVMMPCNTLQHTATHCNTLQHTATHCITRQHTATHCNTLQNIATHYNTWNTIQHTATSVTCSTYKCERKKERIWMTLLFCRTLCVLVLKCSLQHIVKNCDTLQHTATHCNTLQHTATHSKILRERHELCL